MSLERCFPELACVHIHEHDNVADDDGGDQNRMILRYLALGQIHKANGANTF